MPVKRGKDLTRELQRVFDDLDRMQVLVGIPGEAGAHSGTSLTNAELGYIHEFGAPEANIPARPFLLPGIERVREQIADELVRGVREAIVATVRSGNRSAGKAAARQSLQRVGILAQNSVRGIISEGIAPPLSDRTVYARLHRKKRRRSAGPMTPLIDTGQLLKSITYVVTTKE